MQASNHRVPLPHPQITIRQYRAPVPSSESSEGSIRRHGLLERVWKSINETGAIWVEGACAVVDAKEEVVLWVFGEEVGEVVKDLEEIDVQTLDTRKLVLCSAHGNDLACLGSDRKCDVKWLPGDKEGVWKLFGRALVEKQAWREGKRVFTDSIDSGSIDLWPLPSDSLLLIVKPPQPKLAVSPPGPSLPPLVVLRPLGLTALPVGQFDPSPSQLHALEVDFANILGTSWNPPPSLMDLDQLLESAKPAWGVYWVSPSLDSETSSASAEALQGKQGVMTIWPSHLVSSHATTITPVSKPSVQPPVRPLPALDFPEPDSLMSLASGLYDFMAAYEPPAEEHMEITPDTDGPEYPESSPVSHNPPDDLFSPASPARSHKSDGSDLDDLFSAHSPTPPPQVEQVATTIEHDQPLEPQEEENDMGMDIDEVLFDPSPAQMDTMRDMDFGDGGNEGRGGGRDMGSERGEGAFVTEDDFAFFDSPSDDVGQPQLASIPMEASAPLQETLAGQNTDEDPPTTIEIEHVQDGTHVSKGISAPTLPSPVVEATGGQAESVDEQAITSPKSPQQSPTVLAGPTSVSEKRPSTSPADIIQPAHMPNLPSPSSPVAQKTNEQSSATRKVVAFDLPPSPSPEPERYLELVPSPYGPLEIDPSLQSFTYSLPTPAASPESGLPLRTDLIKRIQDLSKNPEEKLDYASQWDIESDVSEAEEEEDNTGAPPTPVSITDEDTQSSTLPTPKVDARGESSELTWEGITLVGCEWVELRWNKREIDRLGRSWKDGWDKNRLGQAPPTPEPDVVDIKMEEVDEDSLLKELVSSRHLRGMLLDADQGNVRARNAVCNTGMMNTSLSDKPALPLIPCQIHVGLHGNVCQMGMSALRYWRQLGLQPVGGKKDVTALLVCDMDEGSVNAAKRFLQSMTATYEACLLGSHETGESAASKDGIISIPPAGYTDTIAGLLPNVSENTVIYVVLPCLSPTSLARLMGKLLSPRLYTPETVFIKLIPRSALNDSSLQPIAFEIYDRLPRHLHATTLRGAPMEPQTPFAHYHTFTLAQEGPVQPELTLAWPLRSYDVLNRWRVVHCAYGLDPAGKRAVGFVMDSEGEGWMSKVFKGDGGEGGVVGVAHELWEFYTAFATLASVEYRLVICSSGAMTKGEIDAWRSLIDKTKTPASLLIAELPSLAGPSHLQRHGASTTLIPPSIFADPSTRLIDESLSGHSYELPRVPFALASGFHTIPLVSFGISHSPPTPSSSASSALGSPGGDNGAIYHILIHRCPPDREDKPLELIRGEYHKLACLGTMRYGLNAAAGPLHLEFVKMGLQCIEVFA